MDTEALPVVSKNAINLNPSNVCPLTGEWKFISDKAKCFSENVKQGLPDNSTFAAFANKFDVFILKHI